MGRTPDRRPGAPLREEGSAYFEGAAVPASVQGELCFYGGRWSFFDSFGEFDPRAVGSAAHRTLRHLIHFLDDGPGEGFASGAYKETLPAGAVFPTSEIWWTSTSKTQKIVELTTTWAGVLKTTEEWTIYDTDGVTWLARVTDAISYSGVFETSRTRTITIAS